MITRRALDEAIAECQSVKSPNAHTCLLLASYLTIRKHLYDVPTGQATPSDMLYSGSAQPETPEWSYDSGTEFSEAIQGKNIEDVISVMDEAMSTIQIVHKRLYDGIISMIKSKDG